MNDEPLFSTTSVGDFSAMLYEARRQRDTLRAEFNIVIKQLEEVIAQLQDMEQQRDKFKALAQELLQSVIDDINEEPA
jgi:ElaB/YqjD/DUF883 family membrane-anchored ribosome-binding protein